MLDLDQRATVQRVYVAFEGGGAKGIVHVGALKAMEEHSLDYKGLAGTSAGAIVASLKAAGYTSDEIVDTENRRNILHLLPLKHNGKHQGPKDLFGPLGWLKIKALSRGARILFRKQTLHLALWSTAAVVAVCLSFYIARKTEYIFFLLSFCFVVMILAFYVALIVTMRLVEGLNKLDTFKRNLNYLLGRKLNPDDPNKPVLMKQFGKDGRPSLKVVASDIKNKKLRLFSSDAASDGEFPVADVVAASICLPIIFRAHRLGGSVFLDGGIVSNLPIWPFDTERALDPDALTFGITIKPKAKSYEQISTAGIKSIIETALFGAAVLNARAIEGLVNIKIETAMDTLDFDANFDRISSEIEASAQVCRAQIHQQVFGVPSMYQDGTTTVREVTTAFLKATAFSGQSSPFRVRVALAMRSDETETALKIRYCSGYDGDLDDGILLPIKGSVVGQAWMTGKTTIKQVPLDETCSLSEPRSRKVRRLVAPDLSWFIAIPIFRSGSLHSKDRPEFVVAIDGTGDFDTVHDPEWLAAEITEDVQNIFDPITSTIMELEDVEATASRWV